MSEAARLFVAVHPPDEVLDVLDELPRAPVAGVRYTTREQWHVTLRFLGTVVVADALAALARVAFDATDAALGPAVERLSKSVVVVPVDGLGAIATAVDGAFAGIGRPRDHDRFTGHLTLARTKVRVRLPMVGTPVAARFAVREVQLVRSNLRADGARYETLASSRAR